MKKIYFLICLALLVLFFGKNLLPGDTMFTFHDVTQPARIAEFVYSIKELQLPPRFAPHMSYGLGYPVFNFYSPFSYWITSFISMIGFDTADSVKLSFLIALVLSFVGMYYLLRVFFGKLSSLLGAVLYTTSPYMAVEIFVRGNLGEAWFLALFPLALYLLYKNSISSSRRIFLLTVLLVSFTLTVHNVLSLLFLPIGFIFLLLLKNKKLNIIVYILGGVISSYFLIPFILESNFTNASQIAQTTQYKDHFLCWWQLWTTLSWGYGASNPGCLQDGMSFMIGKLSVLFSILGCILLVVRVVQNKEKENRYIFIFFILLSGVSAFMTTYSSEFIWETFNFLSIFQFPWRFLPFVLFGAAFFTAYFFSKNHYSFLKLLIPICIIYIFISQSKYFYKDLVTKSDFNQMYISQESIREYSAYRVAEYLPKTGDYKYWRSIENDPMKLNQIRKETEHFIYPLDNSEVKIHKEDSYTKVAETTSKSYILNIHYLPYWSININGRPVLPTKLDKLSRPIIQNKTGTKQYIQLLYKQTPIELYSNLISLFGIMVAVFISWKVKKNDRTKHT